MTKEQMFESLFSSLKGQGFGGPAAHRIAVHLTECAAESPAGEPITMRIAVVKDMIHALNVLETQMSLCIRS